MPSLNQRLTLLAFVHLKRKQRCRRKKQSAEVAPDLTATPDAQGEEEPPATPVSTRRLVDASATTVSP
jgi:hypothetical protein